ncbi:hypothetical protein FoTM2_003350 [Fusarium oxysporum f. sp. vasinfectum]|nr:hypothetical protein FoTM2_003350 [Fusarium oxysporum f. sp. vasinfectum]
MRFLNLATLASAVVAQSDLASILSSQSDLSTLAELLALVPDIAETLASASNITIFAPTNDAFASVPRDIPEGEAISQRNDTIAIGALLSNHVFKGYYPAKVATDIPVFVQSLLDSSFVNYRQPFGNFTGGQYNGIVKDGDDVVVISGEETLSYVTEADIKVGDSVIIHKVDKPLSFGAPLQLFTRRDNLLNFNAALNAADLPYNFGNLDRVSSTLVNISDFTVFIPNDPAFEAIGSVLEGADLKTLQEVLKYHIVDDVLFSTDLANVSVPSLQGADLTFTVAEDGSAWVNGAKILFTNVLLFNGVAHVIDGVLNPADDPFDRADLKPAAEADDRLAFPGATPVSKLPFSVISYADDSQPTYTTPELLKTLKAIDNDIKEIRERLQNGESLRSCATLYGKRESTLRGQLKGAQTARKGQESRQLLSPVQEQEIIDFIKHEERCGRALSRGELRDLANRIVNPDAIGITIGRNWPDRFLKRHPGVKMKASTHLEAARSNDTTPVLLRRFYATLSSTVKELQIVPSRMYNMDEHGLQEGLTKSGMVLGDALTKRATVTESDWRNWVSILESGNAEGRRLRPTVVFQGDCLQEQWFPEHFPNWGYDVSETGWATQDVCLKWLRETFLPMRNIRQGFKGAGIWPISLEKALEKVVAPSQPPAQNPAPRTPQHQRVTSRVMPYTPKSGNELISQVKELQSQQEGYERNLRHLGTKTAEELDRLKAQNTIERQKSTFLQMEIDSQKPQPRQKVVWHPQARYPGPEEIRQARKLKNERIEKKRKREAEKEECRKKNNTIVVADESKS